MIVKFNKPFNVLSQFSDNSENATKRGNLSDFISIPNIYPVGRLDKDSEGLLLLSDDGKLQHKLSNPILHSSPGAPETHKVQEAVK